MNKKVFISLLITAVLCLSMMTAAVFERAEALDVSVDKIFKILSGDTTEIEFDDEGVLITFPASAINASVSYVQPVSFEDFRFDFNANKKFDKLTFSFTDYTDSSNLAYLIIENDNGNIFAYVQKDSNDYMKTNLTDSLVPVVEGETGDEDMFAFSIEFKPFNEAAGVITSFKVNGLDVDSGNGRVTYAYNVVYMDIRMEKSEVNEDGDDTYLLAKSMMNKRVRNISARKLMLWRYCSGRRRFQICLREYPAKGNTKVRRYILMRVCMQKSAGNIRSLFTRSVWWAILPT